MKVLITGGCGYFGSVLTEMLINDDSTDYEVTVVDNLSCGQTNPLFNLFWTKRLKFIYGDVSNEAFIEKLLKENYYDVIIPLAAVVGMPVSEQKPEYTWMINEGAIRTILKYKNGDTKLIYPNTNSGYGTVEGEDCTEEMDLNPISVYGKSKAHAEHLIRNSGKNYVIFRLATLFGMSPRMRTDLLVNDFVYRAFKDKMIGLYEEEFKRNFVHVRDAARAFIYAINNWDKMKGNVYNLGHPDFNITKKELALMIGEQVPELRIHAAEGTDPDKRNYVISNKKILDVGFKFCYPLQRGITELLEGYEAFRDYRFRNY